MAGIQALLRQAGKKKEILYLSSQSGNRDVGHGMAGPDFAGGLWWVWWSCKGDLVRLGRSLERGQDSDPVRDATTMHQHTDRKTLRQERQKKLPSVTKRTITKENRPGGRVCSLCILTQPKITGGKGRLWEKENMKT